MPTAERDSKASQRNLRKVSSLESEIREAVSAFQQLLEQPTQETASFTKGYRFRCTFAWSAERSVGDDPAVTALVRAIELYCARSGMPSMPRVAKSGRLGKKRREEYQQGFPQAIKRRSRGKLLIERFAEHRRAFGHDARLALRTALAIYAEDAKKPPSPDPW